jgi:hypothetical protein
MKRALPLLSLLLFAACASNDGFVDQVRGCGPGEEIGVEAGWDAATAGVDVPGRDRRTMLVRVANNSHEDIHVKFVRVDPLNMQRDAEWSIEGGAREVNKDIAEGEDATFEVPMSSIRRYSGSRIKELDVAVTVVLGEEESVRCRFRVPLGF